MNTPSQEFFREVAGARGRAIVDRFGGAVRSIYRRSSRRRTLFEHVGTCTFLRIDSIPLLVTAAHVIDVGKADGSLWIAAQKTIVPLQGSFTGTESPQGHRSVDRYDFAVSAVTDRFLDKLEDVTFIDSEFVCKDRRSASERALYICLGYPNSKNNDMHVGRREMSSQLCTHSAAGHMDPDKIGKASSRYHEANLFVEVDKQVFDAEGAKTGPVSVRGMSGGPVFCIGELGDYDSLRQKHEFRARLEGIIIEKPRDANVIVAITTSVIVQTVRRHRLFGLT
jgi:hypothetical protein